jgi:hypothetical protein
MENNESPSNLESTEPTKVFIDNWQKSKWYMQWVPILIAITAVITSLISLNVTKRAFIRNTRPFVWGGNYVYVDKNQGITVPIPAKVLMRVKNAPARITKFLVMIIISKDTLFKFPANDLVRYPDDNSEWSMDVGLTAWISIMNRAHEDLAKMKRIIEIRYSSLEGGDIYFFKMTQRFNIINMEWDDGEQSGT